MNLQGFNALEVQPNRAMRFEYQLALASPYWQKLREQMLKQPCRCGKPSTELHHKHYYTLGCETAKDVEPLCTDCHKLADARRKSRK